MKRINIGCGPLTGTIFAVELLKDGRTWAARKQDVTMQALVAVAQHVLNFGALVEISKQTITTRLSIELQLKRLVNKEEKLTIPIKKESEGLADYWWSIVEKCHFCKKQTEYRHERTNNPVCPDCSKKHKVGLG